MEKIEHSQLQINGGLGIHVAQAGGGDGSRGAVLFLHGFPEIWYSWRHQLLAVAAAGFRAIAIDLRGYGLSDQPPDPENAAWEDLVADVLAVLDALAIPKVFLVGKDLGAMPAYQFPLYHPDRVLGVVTLGVPFLPQGLNTDELPKGFYVSRWMEPGRAEADFGRFDVKTVVRRIYILFSGSELQVALEGQEILDLVDPSAPLPPWLSEEDLDVYAALYEKSGFRYPLAMPYRSMHRFPVFAEPRVEAPALLIMGVRDYYLKLPGANEYIGSGAAKRFVPDLEVAYVDGGSHFVQEQFPDKVNQLILAFLNKHA